MFKKMFYEALSVIKFISVQRVLKTIGFYVVSRFDEVLDTKKPDPALPPSVIGRLVIVRVDDYSSTAVITDASRTIPVGSEIITRIN